MDEIDFARWRMIHLASQQKSDYSIECAAKIAEPITATFCSRLSKKQACPRSDNR
jgi:hypothetical protein